MERQFIHPTPPLRPLTRVRMRRAILRAVRYSNPENKYTILASNGIVVILQAMERYEQDEKV